MSDVSLRAPSRLAFWDALRRAWRFSMRHLTILIGGTLLTGLILAAIAAPLLTPFDPIALNVPHRLRPPDATHWFGTDNYGRDVFARTVYGGRISLVVGISAAILSGVIGTFIGILAGMFRWLDPIAMRIMDGLMAIPSILLAVAMMTLWRPGLLSVIVAITVPEVPRVVRLVRSVVLVIREQPYVQAATSIGTRFPRLLLRHILPNALTPIVVQATYICASAVLLEAYLGFLGVGIPPEVPSWGNIMANGRTLVQIAIWVILFPGAFLGIMVLSINMLGDGIRDLLDPRMARRL
jgi:peptide/nickel transport system permease protein